MEIDFEKQPPFFKVSDSHFAATWLLHEDAPKVEMPEILRHRLDKMKSTSKEVKTNAGK
jgi:oligopeptide transport system ATP-binding protein